ncbi:hypothetical protein ALT716_220003 [Alteromonas macleodii]
MLRFAASQEVLGVDDEQQSSRFAFVVEAIEDKRWEPSGSL